ncbi:hypothetical protein RhiirA1_477530 [Rhizophagus irregularis]|uniref:Uncharacterized protein n=1 Tax=Rhizophagus irregularis TaxID=588596 RepID=A0A2I1FKC2_9GLOM|nr:hypothetical protein RhiirA1_477530 [Rhizophagus irregularis]PKY34827.1 hypothetical protein RhiirB3_454927 [Rhizophagus irregularis]
MTDQFDFSDYFIDYSNSSGNRREKIAENTKVSELFKDECNDIIIAEFISLRPKMYSILKVEDDITNPKYRICKVKGIPLKVVKKEFHYEQYNRILFDPNYMDKVTFLTIRSDKHSIHTVEMSKVGLSLMDDKKWIASDNITTYTYGYNH